MLDRRDGLGKCANLMTNERSRHNSGMEAFAILALAITFLLRYTPFLASHLLFGPFLDNVHIYGPIFSEVSRLSRACREDGNVPDRGRPGRKSTPLHSS